VELPYEKILAFAGLNTVIKSEWIPDIGDFLFFGRRNRVVTVEANSPVEEAGLRRRDYILAVDGVEVSSRQEIKEIVKAKGIGSEIVLKLLRDEVELNLTVKVGRKEKVDCEINPTENATQLQMNIQKGWLEGWTAHYISN
jgi:C-terminal processing protease CtpA/Prc